MTTYKVVVDGSNIATEGRTMPSLSQLDEAVRSFIEEHPGADVLVIVDSTFPNRIDRSEQPVFEAAYMAGEIITPPAGTVGRGDAFILKVAHKLGATIFSNDSFQEFHGTYDWLFAKDRLVGGKPIPGLGWVFTARVPVRGPRSREAVRDSKRGQVRIGSPEALKPMPVPKAPPPVVVRRSAEKLIEELIAEVAATPDPRDGRSARDGRDRDGRKKKRRGRGIERADDSVAVAAVAADAESGSGKKRRKRKKGRGEGGDTATAPAALLEAVNPSLTFINFIAAHGIGSEVTGTVERYSSHGMYVDVAGALGYVPLSGLAEPMPRSAKEVIRKGETARWIVKSFDSSRRGIELALVGSPSATTIEVVEAAPVKAPARGRVSKKAAAAAAAAAEAVATAEMAVAPPERAERRSGGRKAVAAAPTPVETATAAPLAPRKNPARKAGGARSAADAITQGAHAVGKGASAKAVATKATFVKAPATKATATKATATKGTATKGTATKAPSAKAPLTKATKSSPSVKATTRAKVTTAAKPAPTPVVPAKKVAARRGAAKAPAPAPTAPDAAPAKKAPSKRPARLSKVPNVAEPVTATRAEKVAAPTPVKAPAAAKARSGAVAKRRPPVTKR